MNLLEYEAKSILERYDIPVAASRVVRRGDTLQDIVLPVVVKSQVPTGGRGKLGGIRVVDQSEDLESTIEAVFALDIKGHTPSTILLEDKLAIARELYLSLLINKEQEAIELVAHAQGGVEVEDNDQASFLRIPLSSPPTSIQAEQLAEHYNLASHTFALTDLLEALYRCFVREDATLIEINPLVVTRDDQLVAGDCKMVLDQPAHFRHPEWQFEAGVTETNFVTLNPRGTVATIANGAGLAMATVDAVAAADLVPANFLDIGGGASSESVLAAFRRIVEFPNIKAIVINIFAGITRCDEVARAIIAAHDQIDNLPPLCVRLAGTNYAQAEELLAATDITLLPTLEACIEAAAQEVSHG